MYNKRKIFIGSRNSNLAKKQASLVSKSLSKIGIKYLHEKTVVSKGDKINFKEFKEKGGKGLFTKEIDNMLFNRSIDLAVHSAKDIPSDVDKRITIAAFLPREDTREVLLTKDFNIKNIFDIKQNIKFGSSSPRRINYLKNMFSYAKFVNLRGNIESRIKKVKEGKIDATLLAYAGLRRLKPELSDINVIKIPTQIILPAPGQGAIAIMCRKEDKEVLNICKKIDHENTRLAVSAERAFIKKIGGDCFTPLAALAKINGEKIEIEGKLFSDDGSFFSHSKVIKNVNDPLRAGEDCAKEILGNLRI